MAKRTLVALAEIEFEIDCETDEELERAKAQIFDRYDFRSKEKVDGFGFPSSMHWYGEYGAEKFWQRKRSKVRSITERPFKRRGGTR